MAEFFVRRENKFSRLRNTDEEEDFCNRSVLERRRMTSKDVTKSKESFGDLKEEVMLISSNDVPYRSRPASAIYPA